MIYIKKKVTPLLALLTVTIKPNKKNVYSKTNGCINFEQYDSRLIDEFNPHGLQQTITSVPPTWSHALTSY